MKIYKKDSKIIIEIPFWTPRSNPYMDENVGKHPTLMGLICRDDWGNEEMGFAQVIDMDYKDKSDQWTDIMIRIEDRNKKDFIALCEEMGLDWFEYPQCSACKKDIYGVHSINDKGQPIHCECDKFTNLAIYEKNRTSKT